MKNNIFKDLTKEQFEEYKKIYKELSSKKVKLKNKISYKITKQDRYIAKKLKEYRKKSNLSQSKLGELSGLSMQQIQKYENATNRISAAKLFEISIILNQPINLFFEKPINNTNIEEKFNIKIKDIKNKKIKKNIEDLIENLAKICL